MADKIPLILFANATIKIPMNFYLIYISDATYLMDSGELDDILAAASTNNPRRNVTGMLLYIEGLFTVGGKKKLAKDIKGKFIQLLEGNEEDVRNAFEVIEQDTRHRNLIIMKEGTGSQRYFKDWSMGFRHYQVNAEGELESCTNLRHDFLDQPLTDDEESPYHFLKSFYQMSKSKRVI